MEWSLKIAVPVFNGYVSPRVDCTRDFTLLEVSGEEVAKRDEISLPLMHPLQLGAFLKSNDVDTLICGGIPFPLLQVVQQQGINVMYGIIGEVDEVVDAYIGGTLRVNFNFCFERRCGRGHRHRGRGRGFGGAGGMKV
jgi:predicted Fe-Mo cluster-binding NifX family protein